MPARHVDANKRGTPLYSVSARAGLTAVAAAAALLVAAGCSSSTSSSSSSVPAATGTGSSPAATSGAGTLSVNDLNNSFSAMAQLKAVAAAGKGGVTVILPDTTSSTRYVEFDAPYLKQAFTAAGLSSSD